MPASLHIARDIFCAVESHCRSAAPAEAVGLLAGRGGTATWHFPLANVVAPPADRYMFLADPIEQWQAEKAIAARGFSQLAVYHSHPDGGTGLSELDREYLLGSKLTTVIIAFSIDGPSASSVAAYQWKRGSIFRVKLNLVRSSNCAEEKL